MDKHASQVLNPRRHIVLKTEIAQIALRIARCILENAKAGRFYDPEIIEWARQIVAGNLVAA